MFHDIITQLIYIFVLLGFSFFFSGSEAAFFSINYIIQEKLKKENDIQSSLVYKLLQSPNKLLITILIGNMIVNILATSLLSALAISLAQQAGLPDTLAALLGMVLMTGLLLFFGEITPKLITIKRPVTFAKAFCFLMYLIVIIMRPLSYIFQGFTDFITSKIGGPEKALDTKDIEALIKLGHKEGIINKEEKEMFENVFESREKEVQEIMMPKSKLFSLDSAGPVKELMNQVVKNHFRIVPVYKKGKDNIIGVVHKQDLLPYYFGKPVPLLKKIIKPIIYVPVGKRINDLLKEFQSQQKGFAMIADEFGNTVGFVTIKDVIEAIIGAYKDEYDKEYVLKQKVGRNKYLINGDMKIEEFNQGFNTNFCIPDVTTVNGLLLKHLGKIPKKGEKIIINKFIFTVNSRKGPAVENLLVEKVEGD
ncbi:MAG: hemolysin family protein [bacterium]|nr:hemolysin family protein [bacterium]